MVLMKSAFNLYRNSIHTLTDSSMSECVCSNVKEIPYQEESLLRHLKNAEKISEAATGSPSLPLK